MSEAPAVLDNAPTPADPFALDEGQIAAMREQWVGLGLDPAAFDQAASGAASFDEPADPALEVLSDLKTPTLTEAEAQTMAAELLRAGVPREQVAAALEADGYALAPDTRSGEEKEFDAAFGAAPPDAYRIDYRDRTPEGMDAGTLADANAVMTEWLSQVGFPPEIGPAVIERAVDAAHRCKAMSEPERELFKREQEAVFVQMAGSEERAEELVELANAALERGHPKFRAILETSGALDDAGVVLHLAHQGERLTARYLTTSAK